MRVGDQDQATLGLGMFRSTDEEVVAGNNDDPFPVMAVALQVGAEFHDQRGVRGLFAGRDMEDQWLDIREFVRQRDPPVLDLLAMVISCQDDAGYLQTQFIAEQVRERLRALARLVVGVDVEGRIGGLIADIGFRRDRWLFHNFGPGEKRDIHDANPSAAAALIRLKLGRRPDNQALTTQPQVAFKDRQRDSSQSACLDCPAH